MKPKLFMLVALGMLVASSHASAQQPKASAKSDGGSFSVSLYVPSSQKAGGSSEVRIQISDLGGRLREQQISGYSVTIRLMEKDVLSDDLIQEFVERIQEGKLIQLDRTYHVNLIRDRSRHSEIYVVVEVQADLIGLSAVFREKASTEANVIRVLKTK
jgi:hypothetical protein